MIFRRGLVLVVAAAALIGCGSTDDPRPAQWSFISATIIEPACATVGCHSKIANRASVDLHDRNTGYDALISRHFVVPGAPNSSALHYLLRGQGSLRMPPDAPLPNADLALIDEWIAGCQVPCND